MIEIIIISTFISMYLWLTEEDGLFREAFAMLASKFKNKTIRKGLFDCLHCRAFWMAVPLVAIFNINYLFYIPLVWILSLTGYKLIN
tara:strand:- start:434 stop:694 length:261 start_codon:yes stop_codon:yes gene_type:complete